MVLNAQSKLLFSVGGYSLLHKILGLIVIPFWSISTVDNVKTNIIIRIYGPATAVFSHLKTQAPYGGLAWAFKGLVRAYAFINFFLVLRTVGT